MQARYAWPPECILWQHQYVDLMFERDGETHLDYGKFHDVAPL
jgi:inward rectifier potassium channel